MTSLADIRAKLQSANKGSKNKGGPSDNYPFWNLDNGGTARLRFLPDKNEENTFFWKERMMIPLEFPGIAGHDEDKPIKMRVPCMEMYGKTCPVLTEIRPWWGTEMEELARKYWVKRSYIFQGFIQESDMTEEETPDNPIRRFVIGPQLYQIIKSQLLDPDMESIPTDYINGIDFIINKTQKGKWPDYSTSKWARRETSLTEDQLEAVSEHGLRDLSEHLPDMPSEKEVGIIFDMFQDSLEGNLYDPEKYAEYFKPYGFEWGKESSKPSTPKPAPSTPAPSEPAKSQESTSNDTSSEDDNDDDVPFDTDNSSDSKSDVTDTGEKKSAEDILAMIRNRKA